MKEKTNELLQFVTLSFGKSYQQLQKPDLEKTSQLAHLIAQNENHEDEHARAALYGSKKNTTNLRKLKSRLKEKLIDGLFVKKNERIFPAAYDKNLFLIERNILAAHLIILRIFVVSSKCKRPPQKRNGNVPPIA